MIRRLTFLSLILLVLLPAFLTGCASGEEAGALKMASLSDMPAEVKDSPVTVQDAYRFNVANPEIMQEIPCYCGCGGVGHTSNYSCYVQEDDGKGNITFDGHALGCSICVDITVDTMRLLKEGKSVAEIKQVVDDTYGQFGPSNINE